MSNDSPTPFPSALVKTSTTSPWSAVARGTIAVALTSIASKQRDARFTRAPSRRFRVRGLSVWSRLGSRLVARGLRVLVAGGSGFLGLAAVRAVAQAGHDAVGLVRSSAKAD